MTREQIVKIMDDYRSETRYGISSSDISLVADAILALPVDLPVNLSIYKKARTLSYHSFCEWFNNEIKKRNQ